MSTLKELFSKLRELEIIAYNRKTKQARIKAFDKVRELESIINNELQVIADKYNDTKVTGKVRYFNDKRGTGLVYIESIDRVIDFHACNAINTCTWFDHTACVEFNEDQEVTGILKAKVCNCYIDFQLIKIEGGKQNLAKFNELNKNNDLAFVVRNGKVTGLFK